jgi:hypothetical protein
METAHFAVTVRNPTKEPLEVRAPFHPRSGQFRIVDNSEEDIARIGVPTIVLRPGQGVTRRVAIRVPDLLAGFYRIRYSYQVGAGVDFRVAKISSTKLWAVSGVHLQPEEVRDEVGRTSRKSASVAFFVVETSPDEYWLYRSYPDTRRDISPYPNREYTLRVLLQQLIGFERIQRLDEPVLSLRIDLRADETADLVAETPNHQPLILHVPVRPDKKQQAAEEWPPH